MISELALLPNDSVTWWTVVGFLLLSPVYWFVVRGRG